MISRYDLVKTSWGAVIGPGHGVLNQIMLNSEDSESVASSMGFWSAVSLGLAAEIRA